MDGAPQILSQDIAIHRVASANPAEQTGDWAKDELRAELLTSSQGFLPYPIGNRFAPSEVADIAAKASPGGGSVPNPRDDSSVAIHSERQWLNKLMAKLDAEGKSHMKAAVRLVVGRRFDRLRMQRRIRDYWRAEAERALQEVLESNQFQLLRDGVDPGVFHKALFSVPMDGVVPYGLGSIGIQTNPEVLKYEVRKHLQNAARGEAASDSEGSNDDARESVLAEDSAEAISAAA